MEVLHTIALPSADGGAQMRFIHVSDIHAFTYRIEPRPYRKLSAMAHQT